MHPPGVVLAHAQIKMWGGGLDPSIFHCMGFEMVQLCPTDPGLKLDQTRENFRDPRMLLSVRCIFKTLHNTANTDQTWPIHRLIRIFDTCLCYFGGFNIPFLFQMIRIRRCKNSFGTVFESVLFSEQSNFYLIDQFTLRYFSKMKVAETVLAQSKSNLA